MNRRTMLKVIAALPWMGWVKKTREPRYALARNRESEVVRLTAPHLNERHIKNIRRVELPAGVMLWPKRAIEIRRIWR